MNDFAVFVEAEKAPIYKGSFADKEEAARVAQQTADLSGSEVYVYSFSNFREIARFLPDRKESA